MDFNQGFYIPDIQKLAFRLPHVSILGTHQCVNMLRDVFRYRLAFQDLLCHSDYAELVVARFSQKIKSEYYGGNSSFTI